MHNCKATRKRLIEEAMTKMPADQNPVEPVELEGCPACLEEFESVRSMLRVAEQAMDSARPAESFWTGYHARLRQSLERDTAARLRSHNRSATLGGLRNLFTSSMRVPVPVAVVFIVLFGLTVAFAMSRRPAITTNPASVITKTIEVPMIQERLVTRVVYRDRKTVPQDRTQQTLANTAARRKATGENPASLSGFKPANEARLTIIKGSYQNDK
jgi:hypothetical protein